MNWIIKNTSKLRYHTNLKELLKPLLNDLNAFKWVLSDLDYNTSSQEILPINLDQDYFILSDTEFNLILNSDIQIIWGVISSIPKDEEIAIDKINLPFSEGNELIWRNNNFQIKNSIIEIIAWDSSVTIIKFKDKTLSDKFKEYFDESIKLDKYNG